MIRNIITCSIHVKYFIQESYRYIVIGGSHRGILAVAFDFSPKFLQVAGNYE